MYGCVRYLMEKWAVGDRESQCGQTHPYHHVIRGFRTAAATSHNILHRNSTEHHPVRKLKELNKLFYGHYLFHADNSDTEYHNDSGNLTMLHVES